MSFSTTYHWQVRAVNPGGSTDADAGTWWSFTTTWENHSPLANPGGPYSADLGSSLSLDGSASSDPDAPAGDSLASFEWDLDEDGVFELTGPTPTVSSAQVDTLGTGDHPISLRVTDLRGATGTAVTTLSIFDNRPVASFTASPNPAACGQSVSFDASGSSHLKPGRSIVTFAWDFGDGQTTTGPIVDHSFSAFGSYSVTLTVTDDNLPARTDEETVIVNINLGNQPPTANAGGPYQVVVGALLNLDGTASSDPDAACGDSLTAFEWDLDNDGGFDDATGSTPSTTFSTPGDHTVALRVQDEFGATSTDTAVVTVLPLTPDAFDKLGPVDGVTNLLTSLTLSWSPSAGASSYEYCLYKAGSPVCAEDAWTPNGATTSKVLSGLLPGTTYYWHVRATNPGGTTYSDGTNTAFWSFTTRPSPLCSFLWHA